MEASELNARALEVSKARLGIRWPQERFEVEPERDDRGFSQLFERPHFQAHIAVFEPGGHLMIELDDGTIQRIASARAPDADDPSDPLDPATTTRLEEAAVRELLAGDGAIAARATVVNARRSGRRTRAVLRGLVRRADGVVMVDLDARTGEELGHLAAPFLRGSRSGSPLSEAGVAERVRAELGLDARVPLVRATLDDGSIGRAWRLRFDVTDETREGAIIVTAHARSGAVAGVVTTVRPRARLGPPPERDAALLEARRAATALLGAGARVDALIPGGLVARRGEEAHPGWLGTAVDDDGNVARVAVIHGWVELSVAGKRHRMPTVG